MTTQEEQIMSSHPWSVIAGREIYGITLKARNSDQVSYESRTWEATSGAPEILVLYLVTNGVIRLKLVGSEVHLKGDEATAAVRRIDEHGEISDILESCTLTFIN